MKVGSGKWERAGHVEFKEFRHSGSENTINTDHDFGVKEIPNEEGVVYRLFRGKNPWASSPRERSLSTWRTRQKNFRVSMRRYTATN